MRRGWVLLAFLSACDGSDDRPETGIRLTVEYESTLDVGTIDVFGQFADGTALDKRSHTVPLSIDPPGIRQVEIVVAIDKPGALSVRADGLDRDALILGSGRADATVVTGELAPVRIILGTPVVCGDRSLGPGTEQCDDGNVIAGDGCSPTCTIEPGWQCDGGVCARCGNGRVEPGEMCDDSNVIPGDGCSDRCQLEGPISHAFEIEQLETQTTTSATWVAIPGTTLTFAPNAAAETWLIFASGKLRSTDAAEVTAEIRLMIDGVESDRFGHQTTGATDNWAGFVTFDRAGGLAKDPITAGLEFRAEVGTTEADDLRIVALRVPPGADLQYFELDAVEEAQIAAGNLGTLRFTPSFAGDYLIFAKVNHSELPGTDTVRSWLEDDRGVRHPNDPNGSTFSNGRRPAAPVFIAFLQNLDLSQHAFTLRGSSSGNVNAPWWDPAYDHRFPIKFLSSADIPAGYAVRVTFDHAALVSAGRSLADGSDVRLVGPTAELDRVVDPDSEWNQPNTTIWFSIDAPIAVGAPDAYFLYTGNPSAGRPLEDPSLVFSLFDGFDELDANVWNIAAGNPSVSGGELMVGPQSRLEHNGLYGPSTIWEVRSRLTEPIGLSMIWLGAKGENETMSWFSDQGDHHAESNGVITHFLAATPTDFHVWRIAREGTTAVHFFQDNDAIAVHEAEAVPLGTMQPYFANETQSASMIYDWIRIRPFVNPEPETTLGVMESIRGGAPSTWSYRKIMALRADAFESTEYAESLDPAITTSPTFETKTELTSEAPPGLKAYVSIQTMRISGEPSLDARKCGELRAEGVTLLATSHKINRTSEDLNGYHHVAGVVDLRSASAPILYQNGFYSPEAINVRAAESVIILLRLPE